MLPLAFQPRRLAVEPCRFYTCHVHLEMNKARERGYVRWIDMTTILINLDASPGLDLRVALESLGTVTRISGSGKTHKALLLLFAETTNGSSCNGRDISICYLPPYMWLYWPFHSHDADHPSFSHASVFRLTNKSL